MSYVCGTCRKVKRDLLLRPIPCDCPAPIDRDLSYLMQTSRNLVQAWEEEIGCECYEEMTTEGPALFMCPGCAAKGAIERFEGRKPCTEETRFYDQR